MRKNPAIDFKGLIARYKSIFANHLKSVIASVVLFTVGYLSITNIDQLPRNLQFLSAIGGFLLAGGFCVLVLLFVVPVFGFILFPIVGYILDLFKIIIEEINTPIKDNAHTIQNNKKR